MSYRLIAVPRNHLLIGMKQIGKYSVERVLIMEMKIIKLNDEIFEKVLPQDICDLVGCNCHTC